MHLQINHDTTLSNGKSGNSVLHDIVTIGPVAERPRRLNLEKLKSIEAKFDYSNR
jgi:hypothetical protein